MADVPQHLRDLVRRSEGTASVTALETEIRSQGAPVFKTEANGDFAKEVAMIAGWEWHYGVRASDMESFIGELKDTEHRLISRIKAIFPDESARKITYKGTFVVVTSERSWYQCKTIWAYQGVKPEADWAPLLTDSEFEMLFKRIRGPFAKDPGATEHLFSLLQLYTYPDDFIVDEEGKIQEGLRLLLEVTKEVSRNTK